MNVTGIQIPIWREGRAALEGLGLTRAPLPVDDAVTRGKGIPVLLIPGYLAGDRSLAPLAGRLRDLGYGAQRAAISCNVDCVTRTAEWLVKRMESITAASGRRTVIVGHSLGGALGRLLAVRRPELVRGVVCLGSPLLKLDAVHPLVWAHVRLVGALGGLGLPGLLSNACLSGSCCAESRELAHAPFPGDVGFVSIYSRSDGIVDWRSCLDPDAEHVEVESSHIGMAVNRAVHRTVAECLAALLATPSEVAERDFRRTTTGVAQARNMLAACA